MPINYGSFQLTPDIAGALSGGIRQGAGIANLYRQKQERDKLEQIKAALSGQPIAQPQTEQQAMLAAQSAELAGISPQAEAEQAQPTVSREDMMQRARGIDPVMAEQVFQLMGIDDASKRAEASRFASRVESLPPAMQDEAIMERAERLRSQGRDPSDTLQLLDMNPAKRSIALRGVQLMDLETKERLAITARPGEGKIGTYNPRDYTTESWAQFVRTRNPDVLKRHTEKTVVIGGVPHALVDGEYKPIKTVEQVAADKALIEETVITARETAKVAAQKKAAELGTLQKLDDADSVYNALKDADFDKIYGRFESLVPDVIRSPDGVLMQANINRLVAMLKIAGRGELKGQGPITDAEQEIVSGAATVLENPNIPPEEARKALDDAMGILYRNAGKTFEPGEKAAGVAKQKIGRFEVEVE